MLKNKFKIIDVKREADYFKPKKLIAM